MKCWSCGRDNGLHYRSCLLPQQLREANANRVMDAYAKGEPVRTSFDAVLPGMPPAVKLQAR